MSATPRPCALEADFPTLEVSQAAEAEAWRKDIHRPATRLHKWWARRLGTVTRAVIASAFCETSSDALRLFNEGASLDGVRVLDPFAGSGTTLVEARHLGAACTGVDINPVASLVQRQAMQAWDADRLDDCFAKVESACAPSINRMYTDSDGEPVLGYFWVARADCPTCDEPVDLFSSYVFAKHATRRHEAHAVCPTCGSVEAVNTAGGGLGPCRGGHDMDAQPPVSGRRMTCRSGHESTIVDALAGERPAYRMYAKLTMSDKGRAYRPAEPHDEAVYARAAKALEQRDGDAILVPTGSLRDGHNTRQAMQWGFRSWGQFFNARQRLCMGLLGQAISELGPSPEREAFCALLSGVLEFNNMLCSYKGEGTGAVRHMFSHHILRPERTPFEAHPWGVEGSSGSFCALYRSRLLRAAAYKRDPYDIAVREGVVSTRQHGGSVPMADARSPAWEVLTRDASCLPHRDGMFDLVVTDPPFFDNINYSELADFFHAWLRHLRPHDGYPASTMSTRLPAEVQGTDLDEFARALGGVFAESARVLKRDGLLAFSFHHRSEAAWRAVMDALREAGLAVTAVWPVKAEMPARAGASRLREPINLDSIVVCRHADTVAAVSGSAEAAESVARSRLEALRVGGVKVGAGDEHSAVTAAVLAVSTLPCHGAEATL